MDLDKVRRRQSLKVIISEAFMVLIVIVTVIILAFIVSGYWVNSDFEVKRQGLLQIYSIPTGADVVIDGESSWLQRTNTSKVLMSGEHTIKLSKEGYDTWSKTINIREGLLYRLHYPRLFLENRVSEKMLPITGYKLATFSPDRASLLLINNSTEWLYINLNEENLSPKKIDISELFSDVSLAPGATAGLFTGEIVDLNWDQNNAHILFKVQSDNGTEWVLLNPKEVKNSHNLTNEFGANFTKVKILDNDSNSLLAVQNNNLHKIDIGNGSISAVLVGDITDFDYYNNEIIFSAVSSQDDSSDYYVGRLKLGDNKIKNLKELPAPALVAVLKFYEDKYIAVLENNIITLYQKEDFKPLFAYELTFVPDEIKVGRDGEFIVMNSGTKIATLDMESQKLSEWEINGKTFDWIDNNMIYSVDNGRLIVSDYDGLNRREIATNVSSHFPAAITNNRFLYYFSDDYLVREWLIPR